MITSAGSTRRPFRRLIAGSSVAIIALVLGWFPHLAAQTSAAIGHHSEAISRTTQPAASLPTLPDYIISPDDVLIIGVYDAPDITGEYRVSPTGQIEIPLLSAPIVAAGRTPGQLSAVIGEKLRESEIVSHPRVSVAIKESRVHAVTIAGAVKRPQIYPVFGKTTLLDVLSQAEGLADDAGNLAIVNRGTIAMQTLNPTEDFGAANRPASGDSTFSVDLNGLMETGAPLLNVDLYPGDRVTVQRAGIIYVVGAVNRPGGFPLRTGQDDMTVIQAVALAEDLKPIAARKKAMIIRQNRSATNGREEIAVNLSNVLAGRDRDTRMQANDILFVPESAGEKALRRGTEAAISAATWGIIYRW